MTQLYSGSFLGNAGKGHGAETRRLPAQLNRVPGYEESLYLNANYIHNTGRWNYEGSTTPKLEQ